MLSNHYKINVNVEKGASKVFVYKLKVSPEIPLENRELKRQLMTQVHSQVQERLGQYYVSGWVVFALKQNDGVNVFST